MDLQDLMLLFVVIVAAAIIWKNAGFKERAVGVAQKHCKALNLQLLDDTVSLFRLKPGRDKRGNWALERHFHFEFSSTGDERYTGHIVFHGERLQHIDLQPHRLQ